MNERGADFFKNISRIDVEKREVEWMGRHLITGS